MATEQVMGINMVVTLPGGILMGKTQVGIEVDFDEIDTTTADDWPWKTNVDGFGSWSIPVSGAVKFGSDDAEDADTVLSTMLTRATLPALQTPVDVAVVIGGKVCSGLANLRGFKADGPEKDKATFSFTLKGTGPLLPASV